MPNARFLKAGRPDRAQLRKNLFHPFPVDAMLLQHRPRFDIHHDPNRVQDPFLPISIVVGGLRGSVSTSHSLSLRGARIAAVRIDATDLLFDTFREVMLKDDVLGDDDDRDCCQRRDEARPDAIPEDGIVRHYLRGLGRGQGAGWARLNLRLLGVDQVARDVHHG